MSEPLTEHEYIGYLIVTRWWSELERLVSPLQDQARFCFQAGQFLEGIALNEQAAQIINLLFEERRASEDRIYWLKLDSQLRLEGKTYPDVYEGVGES